MTDPQNTKSIVDGLAIATTLGTLMEILPSISALLSIIWLAIRIWETETVQKIVGKKDAEQQQETT
jgi:glycerol-3-phosphate acyltransferase PlsY